MKILSALWVIFMAATRHNTNFSNSKQKLKLKSFRSSEHINEKVDGPYHGFDYLSLVSDPLDSIITVILHLLTGKSIQRLSTKYIKSWLENVFKPMIIF